MANQNSRDRGNLFENSQKRKPSQHDMQGECSLGGTAYEIRAWRRDEQLAVSFALPRGDQNTYPPDLFRGALDAGPSKREGKDGASAAWSGEVVGDDSAYTVHAFEKQGKSGKYLTLTFEPAEAPVRVERPLLIEAPAEFAD